MARKTLLTESEIRRFMKLASMPAIGAGRVRTLSEQLPGEDEEMEMGDEGLPEEEPLDDEMPEEEPLGDEEMDMGDEEMDMGEEGAEELPPEAVSAVEDALEQMLDAMGGALEPYGVVMDAERTEGGEEESASLSTLLGPCAREGTFCAPDPEIGAGSLFGNDRGD